MRINHEHDCTACNFLGNLSTVHGDQTKRFDIYVCPNAHGGTEYIARFGPRSEYLSVGADVLQDAATRSDVWTGVINLLIRFAGHPPADKPAS